MKKKKKTTLAYWVRQSKRKSPNNYKEVTLDFDNQDRPNERDESQEFYEQMEYGQPPPW